jgi:hypothetical protein
MRSLNKKGLAARTSHYSFSVLRRALQFAVDWKYIPANPASSRMRTAKRRQVKELSKIHLLTPLEGRAFLNAVRGDRYCALYVLAITTGMRQGEMLGLQWPDVVLDVGKVTILHSLHRTEYRRDPDDPEPWFELRHPKTAGSEPSTFLRCGRCLARPSGATERTTAPRWRIVAGTEPDLHNAYRDARRHYQHSPSVLADFADRVLSHTR